MKTNYCIAIITLILISNSFISKAQDTLTFKSLKQLSECRLVSNINCLEKTNSNERVSQLMNMLLDSGKNSVIATIDERGVLIYLKDIFYGLNSICEVSNNDSLLLFNYFHQVEDCITLIDWHQLHFDNNNHMIRKKVITYPELWMYDRRNYLVKYSMRIRIPIKYVIQPFSIN